MNIIDGASEFPCNNNKDKVCMESGIRSEHKDSWIRAFKFQVKSRDNIEYFNETFQDTNFLQNWEVKTNAESSNNGSVMAKYNLKPKPDDQKQLCLYQEEKSLKHESNCPAKLISKKYEGVDVV